MASFKSELAKLLATIFEKRGGLESEWVSEEGDEVKAIIDLVEELIGEDEVSGKHMMSEPPYVPGANIRNKLRADIRQKLRRE